MENNTENKNEKEQKLLAQLQEMYHPRAVILHGSHVRGDAREKSDWDFILFVDEPISSALGYKKIGEEFVDIDSVTSPFDAKKEFNRVGWVLNRENTKILADTEGIANQFVYDSQKEIEKGFGASIEQKESRKISAEAMIEKLKDSQDDVIQFSIYKSEFIERIIAYYFQLNLNRFKPSISKALVEVKKNDSALFTLIEKMTISKGGEAITCAEEMFTHVFK